MFLFSARAYLDELAQHAPAMGPASRAALEGASRDQDFLRLGAAFPRVPVGVDRLRRHGENRPCRGRSA